MFNRVLVASLLKGFFAFRPACAAPEIIAPLAVLSRFFDAMHHGFAAFGAGSARGLGKGLEFLLQAGMGVFTYEDLARRLDDVVAVIMAGTS